MHIYNIISPINANIQIEDEGMLQLQKFVSFIFPTNYLISWMLHFVNLILSQLSKTMVWTAIIWRTNVYCESIYLIYYIYSTLTQVLFVMNRILLLGAIFCLLCHSFKKLDQKAGST